MKNWITGFLLITSTLVNAQSGKGLFVELSMARYAKELGIFTPYAYPNELSFFNGFNLGYRLSEHWGAYIGVRSENTSKTVSNPDSFEYIFKEGFEFKFGAKRTTHNFKKLSVSYALEFFYETTGYSGYYWSHVWPTQFIDHRNVYLGVAPNVMVDFQLNKHIALFSTVRCRLGQASLKQAGETLYERIMYPEHNGWLILFEPMSSLGFRFTLTPDTD